MFYKLWPLLKKLRPQKIRASLGDLNKEQTEQVVNINLLRLALTYLTFSKWCHGITSCIIRKERKPFCEGLFHNNDHYTCHIHSNTERGGREWISYALLIPPAPQRMAQLPSPVGTITLCQRGLMNNERLTFSYSYLPLVTSQTVKGVYLRALPLQMLDIKN